MRNFNLLTFLWAVVKVFGQYQDCRGQLSFVVTLQSSTFLQQNVISKIPANSLNECLLRCREINSCSAVVFQRFQVDSAVECMLLRGDVRKAPDFSQHPVTSMNSTTKFSYYAYSTCLPTQNATCNRTWSFEFVPGVDVEKQRSSERDILTVQMFGQQSREECFVSCLKHPECRSVVYEPGQLLCHLYRVSRHSARNPLVYVNRKFEFQQQQREFYENNCAHEPTSQCHYLLRKGEGMVRLFDQRRTGVKSGLDCQKICLEFVESTCRSYTFDRLKQQCYLTHISPFTLMAMQKGGLDLFHKNKFLELGDVDDFDLRCRSDHMNINLKSRRFFAGELSLMGADGGEKRRHTLPDYCSKSVHAAYEFNMVIPFVDCGTRSEGSGSHSNMLFVKYGSSGLITYRDRLVKLICRIFKQKDVSVAYRLKLLRNSTLLPVPQIVEGASTPPRFQLRVLDDALMPAREATIGNEGFVEVSVANPEELGTIPLDLDLTSLVATDSNGENQIELVEDGCSTDPALAIDVRRIAPSKIRARIRFFSFSNSDRVRYKGLVKPCFKDNCQNDCSGTKTDTLRPSYNLRRRRNALEKDEMIIETSVHTTLINANRSTNGQFSKWPNSILIEEQQFEVNAPNAVRLRSATRSHSNRIGNYIATVIPEGAITDITDELVTPTGRKLAGPNWRSYLNVSDKRNGSEPHSVEAVPEALAKCFRDAELVCTVSFTLVIMQALIAALCFFTVLVYCKKLKRRRADSTPQIHSVLRESDRRTRGDNETRSEVERSKPPEGNLI